MTWANAVEVPIRTATSGPTAGVLAAAAIAAAAGRANVVSLDMGGTSADIATIQDGQPRTTVEQYIEWGMPIGFPCIELVVIGAEGATRSPGSTTPEVPIRVPGARGRGAGPACYGLGGTEPTNTDANLVLGWLRAGALLGGGMVLEEGPSTEGDQDTVRRPARARPVERGGRNHPHF